MNLKEFLNKYTEENASIDLIHNVHPQTKELIISVKNGITKNIIKIRTGNFESTKDGNYVVKLKEIIPLIKEEIMAKKYKGTSPAFTIDPKKIIESLNLLSPDTMVTIFNNKTEFLYSDSGTLSLHQPGTKSL